MEGQPTIKEHKKMEYAGFWIRFFAFMIDSAIISAGTAVVFGLTCFIFFIPRISFLPLAFITFPWAWLYYAILESSEFRATYGKMALGLRVNDMEGHRISFLRATARWFLKTISFSFFCLGFLIIPFTKRHQGFHDLIAGTVVVKE
jgi:uncharacterized RDD family membrane protein YckC